MNDAILTDSKNAERDFEEAVASLEKSNRNQTWKGVGILVLFVAACVSFIAGAMWTADKVGVDIKSTLNPNDK